MNRYIWTVFLAALAGCSGPPIMADIKSEFIQTQFRRSPTNQYAILMKGRVYENVRGSVSKLRDLHRHESLVDPFVDQDIDQLNRLLSNKEYDVHNLDFGKDSLDDLRDLLENIALVSDCTTRVFIAYSGEGDATGLRLSTIRAGGTAVIPQEATIKPAWLHDHLKTIHGVKALLINACESGIFVDQAPMDFAGIVLAACPQGYATTPYEPYGTTAIIGAFLALYSDGVDVRHNLKEIRIDRAGGFWTNSLHHLYPMFSHKKLSYEPVILQTRNFWL